MADINNLLAQQDEFLELLTAERLEDIESQTGTQKAIDTISTRLHALDTAEMGVIAEHSQKQFKNLTTTNKLLQQIDERSKDPFADFIDGLHVIFNPAQTRKAWAAEARDISRQMELDAAAVEAEKAKTAQKRLSLKEAVRQAEAEHTFELGETAEVEARSAKIAGLIDTERQRRAFASDEDAAIARLLERTPPGELTDEFLAEHGITPEQRRRIKLRKSAENLQFEQLRLQVQKIREVDVLESVPDIFALSYEDAEKMGISRRVLDEERRKERIAKLSLAQGEYALRTGLRAEHEDAKRTFLESLGPRDLFKLAEQVGGDDSTNVAQVGPFSLSQEEILAQLNSREEYFAEQAATETAFAVTQGNTRANIGIWARLAGGNAPAEMTNLAGLEFLHNTAAVPDEYKPMVALFAEAHKRFEALPPESKESRIPAMVMRGDTFGRATAEYVQRAIRVLPTDVQPAATDFYSSGKITNSTAAEAVLDTYVIAKQQTTGNPIAELSLAELEQRVKTAKIPQQEIAALSPSEKRQVQLHSVLNNPVHVSHIIDTSIHAVSHVTHVELAQKLGLTQMLTNLNSTDPKNVLQTENGVMDVTKLHAQLPLYLKESKQEMSLAQYEQAYIKLATEKMLEAFTPQGDGNLQIAALNNVLFDNKAEIVIKHAITSRLAQLDKLAQMSAQERTTMQERIQKMEELAARGRRFAARTRSARHQATIAEPFMHGIPPLSGFGNFTGLSGAELMSLADDEDPDTLLRFSIDSGMDDGISP